MGNFPQIFQTTEFCNDSLPDRNGDGQYGGGGLGADCETARVTLGRGRLVRWRSRRCGLLGAIFLLFHYYNNYNERLKREAAPPSIEQGSRVHQELPDCSIKHGFYTGGNANFSPLSGDSVIAPDLFSS